MQKLLRKCTECVLTEWLILWALTILKVSIFCSLYPNRPSQSNVQKCTWVWFLGLFSPIGSSHSFITYCESVQIYHLFFWYIPNDGTNCKYNCQRGGFLENARSLSLVGDRHYEFFNILDVSVFCLLRPNPLCQSTLVNVRWSFAKISKANSGKWLSSVYPYNVLMTSEPFHTDIPP